MGFSKIAALAGISLALGVVLLFPHRSQAQTTALTIRVDASLPASGKIPVKVSLAASPGPLTLAFPRWLPGMHAPESPLGNYGSIAIKATSSVLEWRRDPYDPYLIHTTVPQGATNLEIGYNYTPERRRSDEVFYGIALGKQLAVINPAAFALAPEGDSKAIVARLLLTLPSGWTAASALDLDPAGSGVVGTIAFTPVSLYTLVDSPIMAGRYHQTLPLSTPVGDVRHSLDLFADSPETITTKAPTVLPLMTRLVFESNHLFGVRHYQRFRYMLALTKQIGRNGLEHHASVAYVLEPDDLDENVRSTPQSGWNSMLIPHEYVHSWNGKFRRPYGENPASASAQQSADLIWVYEGLTQYLGDVLMVRSGFRTAAAFRNDLLARASRMRFGIGRSWQSLADASLAAPYIYTKGTGSSMRSVNDIYYEGELAWFEADAIIRRESYGIRSLDDFCKVFFGGANRGAEVKSYTREDVIDSLKRVVAYDWNGFIESHFYGVSKALPVGGFEASGWHFGYSDKPLNEGFGGLPDYRPSFGALVGADGRVIDVLPDSAASRVGLGIEDTILGVNGLLFNAQNLLDGLKSTRGGKQPLELLVSNDGKYRLVRR